MKSLILIIVSSLIFTTVFGKYNDNGLQISRIGKSTISLKLNSKKVNTAIVTIINQVGTIVCAATKQLTEGDNTLSLIDLCTLKEGTYFITIQCEQKITSTSFIHFGMEEL